MNSNINKTEHTVKLPVGATPYYLAIENRIEELANAILRYNSSNRDTESIKKWAKEITFYCELAEKIKREIGVLW